MFKKLFTESVKKDWLMFDALVKNIKSDGIGIERIEKVPYNTLVLKNGIVIKLNSEFEGMFTIYRNNKDILSTESVKTLVKEIKRIS